GKIGGTKSKGLFVNSDTLMIDILSQRMEEYEPEDSFYTHAMERGNELEPFGRDYICKYTGYEFKTTGWLQSEENELLGISPDGITDDNKIAFENKAFGRKKHIECLLSNEIPKENIHQVIHYFTVNPGLEKLFFLAFRPEGVKHFIKEVTLDTVFDIGTKRKPKKMTVEALRDYANELADELLERIKQKEEELKF